MRGQCSRTTRIKGMIQILCGFAGASGCAGIAALFADNESRLHCSPRLVSSVGSAPLKLPRACIYKPSFGWR